MVSPLNQLIGANLRKKRLELNLTQQELANMVSPNISFQQIQKYERGANRISATTLLYFAEGLGCCIMDFYDKVPELMKGENVTVQLPHKKLPEDDITIYYSGMPEDLKPHVKAICKAFTDKRRMPV